jgi:hypothetical protein
MDEYHDRNKAQRTKNEEHQLSPFGPRSPAITCTFNTPAGRFLSVTGVTASRDAETMKRRRRMMGD